MAKVLVIVVRRYNKNEFWPLLKVLQRRGNVFDIVSTSLAIQDEKGTEGYTLEKTIDDVSLKTQYAGVVLVSGHPKDTQDLWYNKKVAKLVSKGRKDGAVIGAICAAVPAIAHVCKDIKVSAYPLKAALEVLEDAGAIVTGITLTTDKMTVTGENELATTMWAENICDLMEGHKPTFEFEKSPFKRRLGERKPMPEVERLQKIMKETGKDGISGK